jgi:hypothetical protein
MNKIIETRTSSTTVYSSIPLPFLEFTSFTLTFPHKTKTEVKNRAKKEKEYRHRKILVVYNKNHFCPIHHWTILHETNVMWIERHEWGLWKLFMIHLSTKIEVEGKLINKTKCKVQLIPCYWRKFNKKKKSKVKHHNFY